MWHVEFKDRGEKWRAVRWTKLGGVDNYRKVFTYCFKEDKPALFTLEEAIPATVEFMQRFYAITAPRPDQESLQARFVHELTGEVIPYEVLG